VPQLYLECFPGGALSSQEDVSAEECTQILRQLLSAPDYLLGLNPPILHRDIKSSNILVQYRYDGEIYVKSGDFGPSKEE
jgi:serine/threonine protein kinase